MAFPGDPLSDAYFWGVVITMAVLLVGMVLFFRRRGWL